MRWPNWRGWAERSQVERVDLYTRQSLFLLLWGMPLSVLWQVPGWAEDSAGPLLLLVCYLVLGVAATRCLQAACALYPRIDPVPWATVAAFLVPAALVLAAVSVFADGPWLAAVVGTVWCLSVLGLGGFRHRWLSALVVLGPAIPAVLLGQPGLAAGAVAAATFLAFTIRVSLWLLRVVTELDAARSAQAALAVAEERLRFSRDLHDVLGRRLATIAVQSELAAALAGRGDPTAAERMLDVRSVAHLALRETRELARGYRATDLEQELTGARSLLRSAGIACEVDVADLAEHWHEAAGWVVREAVTNVLRHSSAATVRIAYDEEELTVTNDGLTSRETVRTGTGLRGLRERLAPLGADLAAGVEDDRFVVRARMPVGAAR